MPIVDDKLFQELMREKTLTILQLSEYISGKKSQVLNRLFLSKYYSAALTLEELMDHYGAQNNKKWFTFRNLIAAVKWFSKINYNMLHIESSVPVYHLLSLDKNFIQDTEEIIAIFSKGIKKIAINLIKEAADKRILVKQVANDKLFNELRPEGKLKADKKLRNISSPGEMVVYLVSTLLNVTEDCQQFRHLENLKKKEYEKCFPEILSEEKLRLIENRIHNLQSLYDTNISDTNIESKDSDLSVIHGHVSIIYHLLESATDLAHVFERHMKKEFGMPREKYPVTNSELLVYLVNYFIAYAFRFLESAKELCHAILKKYAEQARITVDVPGFRGFHVRPSTLIAKIVHHYGSEVFLEMNEQEYDASNPLELFRVNEEINAYKRRMLALEIDRFPLADKLTKMSELELKSTMRNVLFTLFEKKKIILYETNFEFSTVKLTESESLLEFAKRGIAHCLALGRIDIQTDLQVSFSGDKRVLMDIKTLAENGYGEDPFGNNIVLPKELSYLRR